MGRHKKECNCELCSAKKAVVSPPETKKPDVEIKNQTSIQEDIKHEIEREVRPSEVKDVEFFTLSSGASNAPVSSSTSVPVNTQLPEPSLEEKAEKLKPIVGMILPGIMNMIFIRMNVSTLTPQEEKALTDTSSLVLAKYSSIYEFKYKEEVALGSTLLTIVVPRVMEYNARKSLPAEPPKTIQEVESELKSISEDMRG